eukprot:6132324-Amphidinium_carterae.1
MAGLTPGKEPKLFPPGFASLGEREWNSRYPRGGVVLLSPVGTPGAFLRTLAALPGKKFWGSPFRGTARGGARICQVNLKVHLNDSRRSRLTTQPKAPKSFALCYLPEFLSQCSGPSEDGSVMITQ